MSSADIEAFLRDHPGATEVRASLPGCPTESPTPSPVAPKAKKASKTTDPIQWALFGLPEPTREYRFAPPRRWRFDFAWVEQKIALEVEGGIWTKGRHTRGKGFLGDMAKYNEAVLMGWRLLRCTPKNIEDKDAVKLILRAFAP